MDILTALQVYKELADWYDQQGQAAMRDRFLILAAEAALTSGDAEGAERLRQRLLQSNPHHMLKPFSSFAQALQSTNIQIYIRDLQVNYPPETAEALLHDLRSGASSTPPARERDALGGPQPGPSSSMEISDESTRPQEPATGPLKVYPLREEPPAQTAPPNRPAARSALPPPERGARREAPLRPRVQPRPLHAAPPASAPLPPPENTSPPGAWLSLLLCGMVVTAGIALAAYTLARPFLAAP